MDIAMIGAGRVGKELGIAFTRAGHDVTFVSRDPAHAREFAEAVQARSADNIADAVAATDIAVLAVRFPASGEELAMELAPLVDGTIVVDVSNAPLPDMTNLMFDAAGSATEQYAAWMPEARMVKAFNTLMASNMADAAVDGMPLDGFVAADDDEAKAVVTELVSSVGLRPIDAGPLSAARFLEQLAWLNMSLDRLHGWGWTTGWKLVGIPDGGPDDV